VWLKAVLLYEQGCLHASIRASYRQHSVLQALQPSIRTELVLTVDARPTYGDASALQLRIVTVTDVLDAAQTQRWTTL